jgi:hypothetical protein
MADMNYHGRDADSDVEILPQVSGGPTDDEPGHLPALRQRIVAAA